LTARERSGALIGFALLAGYAGLHWFALVADPALWRWAVCVVVAIALVLALDALDLAPRRRAAVIATGSVLVVAALAAGFLAAGVPARLLAPGGWGELRANLDAGLAGISQVDLPYAGVSAWTRIGILLAAPLTLVAAAAVAYWPGRRRPALRRGIALTLLVALYAVSVTWESPESEPLHGLGLLICIAAFLWLGRLPGSRALAAGAAILVAGLAALPAAARVDSSDPVIDYSGWRLFGNERTATFDWDHSYGPLDWPQRGLELFEVQGAERPMYWRTAVLDEFGGATWARGDGLGGVLIDAPEIADLSGASGEVVAEHSRWVEELQVSVLGLRSSLLVAAGIPQDVDGVDVEPGAPDGTTTVASGGLTQGSEYTYTSYVPDPSARTLKRRDDARYPRGLEQYTHMLLPEGLSDTTFSPEAAPVGTLTSVTVPIRGSRRAESAPPVTDALAPGSSYARVARLARRITKDAGGNYQAVAAIERHLLENYVYEQEVPDRPEPLPAFLFDDRRGYCQQFSGAMALMLRMVGIPSRVVSGFAAGLPDPDEPGTYMVRDTDAHSWVEVWFPKVGWVTVDPTPAASPARTETTLGPTTPGSVDRFGAGRAFDIEESAQSGPVRRPSLSGGSDDGSPLGTIVSFAAILAVIGLFVVYRRRRARLVGPEGAGPQLHELERAMTLLGHRAGPRLTLLGIERELATALGPEAARYPAALRFNRFAAGVPRRPGPDQRRGLRSAFARGRGIRGRWRALRAFPPGGPGR
jgi:protein-glutamine gamma-glutamyltransferase